MITVRFKKAADDSFMGFRVSGHAGWAALGKDIVCAAVSATVWQTANGLVKFADAKVTQDKKGVYCIIPVPSEHSHVLVQSLYDCLSEMQKQYSDYLDVKIVGRKDGI